MGEMEGETMSFEEVLPKGGSWSTIQQTTIEVNGSDGEMFVARIML